MNDPNMSAVHQKWAQERANDTVVRDKRHKRYVWKMILINVTVALLILLANLFAARMENPHAAIVKPVSILLVVVLAVRTIHVINTKL